MERRCLLAVAPVEADWEPSLEDYVAETHEMGPVAPAEDSTATDAPTADEADAYFSDAPAEGEVGDGSAGGGTITEETPVGEGESSTSGTGGAGEQGLPPAIVSMTVEDLDDTLLIWGQVTDDENPAGYAVAISGLVIGEVQTDEFGYFRIEVPKPTTSGEIIAVATDGQGYESQEFSYYYDAD